jgi:hypothetical protein
MISRFVMMSPSPHSFESSLACTDRGSGSGVDVPPAHAVAS